MSLVAWKLQKHQIPPSSFLKGYPESVFVAIQILLAQLAPEVNTSQVVTSLLNAFQSGHIAPANTRTLTT